MEEVFFEDIIIFKKYYPDFLQVEQIINLSINDKLDPYNLPGNTALVYKTNLYITDDNGNMAYFDCDMRYTDNAGIHIDQRCIILR